MRALNLGLGTLAGRGQDVKGRLGLVIRHIAEKCRGSGAQAIVIGPFPDPGSAVETGFCRRLDRKLTALCAELGVTYLSAYMLTLGRPDYFLPDDFHLSAEGHKALAERIEGLISAANDG